MSDLVPAIILIGLASTLFWILRTFSDNATRRKLADTRAGIHRDLLSKFGSSQELLAYLSTDAGRELVGTAVELERPSPFKRILGAVQSGLVLVSVGIGFLVLGNTAGYGSDGRDAFTFLGGMSLAVGIGFLASAVAAWVLSRRWGLVGSRETRNEASS
jgi:hypothetical protein